MTSTIPAINFQAHMMALIGHEGTRNPLGRRGGISGPSPQHPYQCEGFQDPQGRMNSRARAIIEQSPILECSEKTLLLDKGQPSRFLAVTVLSHLRTRRSTARHLFKIILLGCLSLVLVTSVKSAAGQLQRPDVDPLSVDPLSASLSADMGYTNHEVEDVWLNRDRLGSQLRPASLHRGGLVREPLNHFNNRSEELIGLLYFLTSMTSNRLINVDPKIPLAPEMVLDFRTAQVVLAQELAIIAENMNNIRPIIIIGHASAPTTRQLYTAIKAIDTRINIHLIDLRPREDREILERCLYRLLGSDNYPKVFINTVYAGEAETILKGLKNDEQWIVGLLERVGGL